MPPAELAATILPLFSSTPYDDEQAAIEGIASWCKTGEGRARRLRRDSRTQFENPDYRAVAEAIQVLEHAGLLMRSIRVAVQSPQSGGSLVGLTRLGMHALQTNTVRQHLGLGDAAPTT
jgi:hypothetical protein